MTNAIFGVQLKEFRIMKYISLIFVFMLASCGGGSNNPFEPVIDGGLTGPSVAAPVANDPALLSQSASDFFLDKTFVCRFDRDGRLYVYITMMSDTHNFVATYGVYQGHDDFQANVPWEFVSGEFRLIGSPPHRLEITGDTLTSVAVAGEYTCRDEGQYERTPQRPVTVTELINDGSIVLESNQENIVAENEVDRTMWCADNPEGSGIGWIHWDSARIIRFFADGTVEDSSDSYAFWDTDDNVYINLYDADWNAQGLNRVTDSYFANSYLACADEKPVQPST